MHLQSVNQRPRTTLADESATADGMPMGHSITMTPPGTGSDGHSATAKITYRWDGLRESAGPPGVSHPSLKRVGTAWMGRARDWTRLIVVLLLMLAVIFAVPLLAPLFVGNQNRIMGQSDPKPGDAECCLPSADTPSPGVVPPLLRDLRRATPRGTGYQTAEEHVLIMSMGSWFLPLPTDLDLRHRGTVDRHTCCTPGSAPGRLPHTAGGRACRISAPGHSPTPPGIAEGSKFAQDLGCLLAGEVDIELRRVVRS